MQGFLRETRGGEANMGDRRPRELGHPGAGEFGMDHYAVGVANGCLGHVIFQEARVGPGGLETPGHQVSHPSRGFRAVAVLHHLEQFRET